MAAKEGSWVIRECFKYLLIFVILIALLLAISLIASEAAAKPPTKSKFYDFNEQIIDGEIRKPTTLYVNARQRAKFDRLLKLKKSFLPKLFMTSKEKVFK